MGGLVLGDACAGAPGQHAVDDERRDAADRGAERAAPEQQEAEHLPPVELAGVPGLKSFDLRGDAKSLFQQLTQAFGLETVFDVDYVPGQPVRFQLRDVDFRTALRALEAATSSFVATMPPAVRPPAHRRSSPGRSR